VGQKEKEGERGCACEKCWGLPNRRRDCTIFNYKVFLLRRNGLFLVLRSPSRGAIFRLWPQTLFFGLKSDAPAVIRGDGFIRGALNASIGQVWCGRVEVENEVDCVSPLFFCDRREKIRERQSPRECNSNSSSSLGGFRGESERERESEGEERWVSSLLSVALLYFGWFG
jgi:hypothetical protein